MTRDGRSGQRATVHRLEKRRKENKNNKSQSGVETMLSEQKEIK
jgi:hypothetical protein